MQQPEGGLNRKPNWLMKTRQLRAGHLHLMDDLLTDHLIIGHGIGRPDDIDLCGMAHEKREHAVKLTVLLIPREEG